MSKLNDKKRGLLLLLGMASNQADQQEHQVEKTMAVHQERLSLYHKRPREQRRPMKKKEGEVKLLMQLDEEIQLLR